MTINIPNTYSDVTLVSQNDYEYSELRRIITAPKNDGDVLMWKDGGYKWLPIKDAMSYYIQMCK